MSKQSQFPLIAMSILLASSMLVGCSGTNSDGGAAGTAASSQTASASTATTPPPVVSAPAPIAYTPGPIAGVVTTCNIEEFDQLPFQTAPVEVAQSATHSVGGWIAAPQMVTPSFWLRLDDKAQNRYFQVPVALSVKRPDVVSSANNSAIPLLSGFALNLPVHALPVGQYHLYLVAQGGGKTGICDSGRQVDFR